MSTDALLLETYQEAARSLALHRALEPIVLGQVEFAVIGLVNRGHSYRKVAEMLKSTGYPLSHQRVAQIVAAERASYGDAS